MTIAKRKNSLNHFFSEFFEEKKNFQIHVNISYYLVTAEHIEHIYAYTIAIN